MASREGQGLQIAVIMFAMLTIILAITTYIFYAQSESARKSRIDAETAKATVDAQNKKLTYRVLQMKHVLGLGNVQPADVDFARTAAGGADPEAEEVQAAFAADMALFGDDVAPDAAKNYRTLPVYLLKAINKKHDTETTALGERDKFRSELEQTKVAEAGRVKAAEDSVAKASADIAALTTTYNEQRAATLKEKEDLAARLAKKDAEIKTAFEGYQKNLADVTTAMNMKERIISTQKVKIRNFELGQTDLFENPDGRVHWVNQKQKLVWINLGRADGLERQTTFAVYDHNENGVANAEPKARIEVVAINDDHMSECRILEDSAANPILPNDIVNSSAWSPGHKIHFALVGFMDIDGDHVSDRALIRNLITMNGGVIDQELGDDGKMAVPGGEITVNTRYLVTGEKPTEKSAGGGPEYGAMIAQARLHGVEEISVRKLLDRMGWKAEERTVEFNRRSSSADFRRRPAPGSKAATDPAAPATTDPAAAGAAPADAAPAATAPAPAPAAPATPASEAPDPFK